jgi:probable DNA metabolism protein
MAKSMEEYYLVCEDSPEGVFTGIYEAYAMRKPHGSIHIQIGEEENLRLFATYKEIEPEPEKSLRVAETLERRLGPEAYVEICCALAAQDGEKGEAVYKTVVCGFGMKDGRQVMGNLAHPHVHKVFELARNVKNEAHHWKEFLRFQELEDGVLFSKIGPKNNIVTFLMPHFADRLPLYNFMIYDENRKIFAVHPASGEWYLVSGVEMGMERFEKFAAEEERYQELFRFFCKRIAIKERKNLKLQRNMLPLWFQEYMVEFGE